MFVPGKEHVTPDCFSRWSDHNHQALAAQQTIDLLDISNVRGEYATSLTAPSWVSQPVLDAFIAHPSYILKKNQAEDVDMMEALLVVAARSSGLERHQEATEVAPTQPNAVRMISWVRLQQAVFS